MHTQQAPPSLDAGSLTQLYSSLCATPVNSSNTPQLSQQKDQKSSNQRAGRLAAKQADCMQQDYADSHS